MHKKTTNREQTFNLATKKQNQQVDETMENIKMIKNMYVLFSEEYVNAGLHGLYTFVTCADS